MSPLVTVSGSQKKWSKFTNDGAVLIDHSLKSLRNVLGKSEKFACHGEIQSHGANGVR